MSSYFYRIEFQQRGAPHVHSLLWLKNKKNEDAPNFWIDPSDQVLFPTKKATSKTKNPNIFKDQEDVKEESHENCDELQERIRKIEELADFLITTDPQEITCGKHEVSKQKEEDIAKCNICQNIKAKAEKYQSHHHTFTCDKKMKTITVKADEGHGRLDGHKTGAELSNISICRFRFPKFPLDETKLIFGKSKDANPDVIKTCRADLNKITKYLLRQTQTEKKLPESESLSKLKSLSFWEFLFEVGMFGNKKSYKECNDQDKNEAKTRYLDAISASVQGTAAVILKREVKNIYLSTDITRKSCCYTLQIMIYKFALISTPVHNTSVGI